MSGHTCSTVTLFLFIPFFICCDNTEMQYNFMFSITFNIHVEITYQHLIIKHIYQ